MKNIVMRPSPGAHLITDTAYGGETDVGCVLVAVRKHDRPQRLVGGVCVGIISPPL